METKPITILEELTTQYSKFNKNQVLTEKQLNEFLDYFNDQDHLSRIALSGVGIVCGFNIDFKESIIKITHGYGVTTDGDLLKLQNPINSEKTNKYTHYKVYEDNIVNYSPFNKGETKIELLELKTSNEDATNLPLNELDNLEDKVVLLYLENYQKGTDLCTELSCDNQGLEQVANLKVLLVSISDAKHIVASDAIYTKHNWHKTYLELPEVIAKRLILTNTNTNKLSLIKQNYTNAIKNETLTKLAAGYETIFLKFGKTSISEKINTLLNLFSTPSDFQYRYDVFKDLIDTYNEIKELLLHINVECCPNIGAFPKHLMLGKLNETAIYKTLRHQFYKSPIVDHEDKNYKKVLLLLDRAYQLVDNYEINATNIKITPSQINTDLAKKAIPFYYDVNNKVLDSWSFEKTINLSQKLNLSYHTENLANIDSVQNPLSYNIDKNNFFRIEGHQGKMYQDALDQILNLKKRNGLNFDVKTLSINASTESINIDDYKCEFEELAMLLKAWRTEQNCILAEMSRFFSGFSTIDAGVNIIGVIAGYEPPSKSTKDLLKIIKESKKDLLLSHRELKVKESNKGIPKFGKGIPKFGKGIPKFGKGMPKFGKGIPKFGKGKEKFGKGYLGNVVEEQLTTEADTLGQYLEIAIAENANGSANDIMASFQHQTGPIMTSEAWIEEPELAEFVFGNISEIVVHSYILDNIVPSGIREIDYLTLVRYKLTIDKLCAKVKTLQAKYRDKKIKGGSKEILGLLINQMSTVCCSGKKLEILLDEIEKRKKEILIQTQLSEFVKKHPGLEHKAGVELGGTFVMVYLAENATDQTTYETVTMELDFLKQPNIDDDGTDGDEGVLKLWNDRASARFAFLHKIVKGTQNPRNEIVLIGNTIEETVANLVDFLNNIWKRAGFTHNCKAISNGNRLIIKLIDVNIRKKENFIQFFNPAIVGTNKKIFFSENDINQGNVTAKNTVVADFSLPYMCCSDCTPINFIIQNVPIVTTLDIVKTICLDTNTEEFVKIPFTNLNPIDGLIEIEGDEIKGLEIVEEHLIINPLVFTTFNEEINFTVNGLPTTASINIHKIPVLNVVASTPNYNDDKTEATITYTVSGEDLEDITTFTWDFEGNGTTTVETLEDNQFKHTYNLPVGETNKINPILTVNSDFCSAEIVLDTIEFEDQIIVEISLDIKSDICLDIDKKETRVPFIYTGPNSEQIIIVNTTITGLQIDNNTRELIIILEEFTAFDQEIAFTVNGLVTNPSINIHKVPTASFTFVVTSGLLTLSNTSSSANSYDWNVAGELITRTIKNQVKRKISIYESNVINVSLTATNNCGESVVFQEEIRIREEKVCFEPTLQVIIGVNLKLDTNLDVTTKIRDTILIPTKQLYEEVVENANDYLDGLRNNSLESKFINLLRTTVSAMEANSQNEFTLSILSNFYKAQIRLFFNILHCQPNDLLIKDENIINIINDEIRRGFQVLNERNIKFDSGGGLKTYLTLYSNEDDIIEYIATFMQNELIPLL